MPYFVYKTLPFKQLELLQQFDSYREAREFARSARQAISPAGTHTVKLIFAENALQAEDLLTQERPPEPMIGDDY